MQKTIRMKRLIFSRQCHKLKQLHSYTLNFGIFENAGVNKGIESCVQNCPQYLIGHCTIQMLEDSCPIKSDV